MAASVIPPISTKEGPCSSCKHTDCQELRAMASSHCSICDEIIGYGRRFYYDKDALVHASCLEDQQRS